MTDFIWVTDPHFNFIKVTQTEVFGTALARQHPHADACIMSGDIAEARDVVELLHAFMRGWKKRVLFVLGNHDYYGGEIDRVHKDILTLCATDPRFVWLDQTGFPSDTIPVVGAGGWYDGVCGDAKGSRVIMSDFRVINDLRSHYPGEKAWSWYPEARIPLLTKIQTLAAESAALGEHNLRNACGLGPSGHIIFVTHYPPYQEACWHEGKISDSEWLPWFTCSAMGEMLDRVAADHPEHKILVLCGHTHSNGVYHRSPSLCVLTGSARYGHPSSCLVGTDSFREFFGS